MGFPGGSDSKESACNVGDTGFDTRSRRTPLEWNVYPLQYSCLDNPWNRVLWYIIFQRAGKESDMTE